MQARTRAITAGVAMAALGGSFATGYALAGRPPSADRGVPDRPAPELRLANADLSAATSCDDLLAWYVDRGVRQVTPYGWEDLRRRTMTDVGGTQALPGQAFAKAPLPTTSRSTSSGTGTNTQEAGVDEPDLVKTDGRLLVRSDDDRVTTYDVTGAHPEQLDSIELPGMSGAEILLAGDTVVAIGQDDTARTSGAYAIPHPDTRVVVLDVSDPGAPRVTSSFVVDSDLVAARQTGDTVRLVLGARLPDLDFVEPGRWRSDDRALEQNRGRIRASTIEDWLPTVTTYDGSSGAGSTHALVDCDQVALPQTEAGLGTMVVAGFDVDDPTDWNTTGVATASDIVYMSTDRLYLATGSWWAWPVFEEPMPMEGDVAIAPGTVDPEDGTTQLYSFALEGTGTRYVASGEVDGQVADRWSMDESGGVLRVAVGPTSQTGDFSSILTLVEDGNDLVQVGHLDKLGVGETIQAVRWFDDLALVVTFRQVDPIYAVDLSTPARPRLIGSLEIPGFSAYLHPLGQRRLIGLGTAADRQGRTHGAQAALFTVRDLTHVDRMDVVRFGDDTTVQAATDPRQFTWLPDQRTALAVISQGWTGRTGSVAIMHVEDGHLKTTLRDVEYGSEVDQVRLVPLPTGRVVLVTGDGVRFFDPTV